MHVKNDKRLAGLALAVCLALISSHSLAAGATASVFRFQQKMADKGMPQAQYKLAMMYETGEGVDRNLIQAKLWYGRAAYQDYRPASHRLTYLDVRQNGFDEQHREWLQTLRKDSVSGNGEATFLLGQMYAKGIGLPRDLKKSIALLRKASASNVPGSETELLRVESMRIAEQELKQKQQQKAAEQEHAERLRKEKLQEQRQKRLEQEREARERQLIAERERQQRLLRIRQQQLEEREKQQAYQRALQSALDTPVLISETDSSNICSGRNRFSATCR